MGHQSSGALCAVESKDKGSDLFRNANIACCTELSLWEDGRLQDSRSKIVGPAGWWVMERTDHIGTRRFLDLLGKNGIDSQITPYISRSVFWAYVFFIRRSLAIGEHLPFLFVADGLF
jgi:hypothetical protein